MKTFVPYHHENGSKIFACNQICDFSAHAREHVPGYKTAFPLPRARGLEIFQNNSYDSNFGRSSDECMTIPMLKPTAQRQKFSLIFGTRKMLVFRRSTSLGDMVDVNADVNHMLYIVLAT